MNEKTHRFVSDVPHELEGRSGRLCGEFLLGIKNGCEVPDGWCRFIGSEVKGGIKSTLIVFCFFKNGKLMQGPLLRYYYE